MNSTLRRTAHRHLFAPVDNAFLVFFRMAFGAIMLWEVWRYFDYQRIGDYYIQPKFLFKYYGFEWVQAWGGNGMYWHFCGLGALAFCILVGFCYRVAAALFFVGFTYVFLLDQTRYLNHFYLISLIAFLMPFLPANRAFAIDALMRPKIRSGVAPVWTLWLLRAQIGLVYFFGGIAKLNADWLQGEPMRMWLASRTDYPVVGPLFTHEWMVYAFTYGGLLLDLCIVPLLLFRRTRWFGMLWGASFHLLNAWLFYIGIFPWFMLCASLIFFPPDSLGRVAAFIWRREEASASGRAATTPAQEFMPLWTIGHRVTFSLLIAYLLFQCAMPLRHFLYPGKVSWTEEGHRFSWHMKLRGKKGDVRFEIVQPGTGRSWDFDPRTYLLDKQVKVMATRPDMILQMAHHLAERMRHEGFGELEVYAHGTVSLNGRKPQPMVDPRVNLAKEPRSLRTARWIVPLKEALPDANERHARHNSMASRVVAPE